MSISPFLYLLVLMACDNSVDPQPDYHNKILFTSSRSGKSQLYVMNPDGSEIGQITGGPFWHNNGRWSPDSRQIVCNTEENSTTAGLMMVVMNEDGTSRRSIGPGSQMAWSLDGKKIFFVYCPSCEIGSFDAGLYSVDPDGQNEVLVSRDWAGEMAFSADGNAVAFVYVNPSDSIPRSVIKIMDYPSFGNVRSVGPIGVAHPRWSPKNAEILFSFQPQGQMTYDIFVMDTTGEQVWRLTSHQSLEHFYFPRWSSDGSKIIFLGYSLDGTQRKCLYMVNREGTDLRRVLDDSTTTSADWSR